MTMMSISTEKNSASMGDDVQGHILQAKLRDSKKKLGNLIILNLLVCPLLFIVICATLWIELSYPTINSSGICYLIKHLNGTHMIASLIVWAISHLCDIYLLLAVTTGNQKYCRFYGGTLGPMLEILVLFFFTLVMWSTMKTMPNYSSAKFLIISCSVIALIANFYNYFMSKLAEHFLLLSKFKLMKFKTSQAV